MARRALRWIFNALLALLTHRRVEGLENIPDPPYVLVVNHLGMVDVPLMFGLLGGSPIVGWAAEKYERHPFFGPILKASDAIFIQRGQVDREALNKAVEALRAGKSFGLAPEGTRSANHTLIRGKTGAAYLAAEADVPVVPSALTGTEDFLQTLLRLRRPRLTVRVGKPFRLPPLPEEDRAQALRRNTDEIMCRIAALLPPEYRGVYADYERTLELLAANGAES